MKRILLVLSLFCLLQSCSDAGDKEILDIKNGDKNIEVMKYSIENNRYIYIVRLKNIPVENQRTINYKEGKQDKIVHVIDEDSVVYTKENCSCNCGCYKNIK